MLKFIKKTTASMIAIIIIATHFAVLGINTVYAANELENQKIKTNNKDVEFDVFFENASENTHSVVMDLKKEANITLNVNVKGEGYLRDSKVEFISGDNGKSNMQVKDIDMQVLTEEEKEIYEEYLQEININDNSVIINQINKKTDVKLKLPITFNSADSIKLDEFAKINKAKFSGTYVNAKGEEKEIDSEIEFELKWTTNPEVALEQKVSKIVPYDVEGTKGLILETILKSGIKGNTLPVKASKIEINTPKFENIILDNVMVSANSTMATNGDEKGYNFNEENWTYNKEQGKVEITVNNIENENNEMTWKKNSADEFVITYILKSIDNREIDTQTINSYIKAKAIIDTFSNTELQVTSEIETPLQFTQELGDMVSLNINSLTDISKGIIYSNYDKQDEKLETEYSTIYDIDIGYYKLTDSIVLRQESDKYVDSNGTIYDSKIENVNYIYNKAIKVDKIAFDKILGEKGSISIMRDGLAIATIDSNSIPNKNGEIELDTSTLDLNNTEIYVSKPIENGRLEISVIKAIKPENGYTLQYMQAFQNIITTAQIQSLCNKEVLVEKTVQGLTKFLEPQSKAELFISNDKLSTIVANENVEIRAILNTNDITDSLYVNPTIDIVFPEYVEDINIKDAKLMFEDELKVTSAQKLNENGRTIIRVQLEGIQTKYNLDSTARGTNISLVSDIKLKKLTPNRLDEIQMYYTNEKPALYENTTEDGKGLVSREVKLVSPTGLVAVNSLENYSSQGEKIVAQTGKTELGTLDTQDSEYTAKSTIDVINNYENNIKNIKILGRTYKTGNKNIATGEELGTTVDMNMVKEIKSNNIPCTIYYSENGEATDELDNRANGWTTEIEDIANVKSYLIVMDDEYILEEGTSLKFDYDINVPERLGYNKSAFSMYTVFYDRILEDGDFSEKVVSPIVGVTTGDGPEVETTFTANVENGAEVKENDIIEFNVTVKNVGKTDIRNISIIGSFPLGITYVEKQFYETTKEPCYNDAFTSSFEEKIDFIKQGESKTLQYYGRIDKIEVNDICTNESHYEVVQLDEGAKILQHKEEYKHGYEEYTRDISMKLRVQTEKAEELNSQSLDFIAKKQYALINLQAKPGAASIVGDKQSILYEAKVKNEKIENLEDVMVKAVVPEGTQYSNAYIGSQFNVDGVEVKDRMVTWNLGTMASQEQKTVSLEVVADTQEEKAEIKNAFNLSALDESEIKSNEVSNIIMANQISIEQSTDVTEPEIENGDEVSYILTIENYGYNGKITIEKDIPSEMHISKITQNKNGLETEAFISAEDLYSTTISTKSGDKIIFTVKCIADLVVDQYKEVSSIFKIKYDDKELTSNEIKHTIKNTYAQNLQNGLENSGRTLGANNNKYRIAGKAWLDLNKDGQRDNSEELLQGIDVKLINKSTNLVERETTTSNDGSYTFENIDIGEFYVLYVFDTNKYSVTTYKADGVSEDKNNDATYVDNAEIEGITSKVGLTDTITLRDKNIYNIDLGLILNRRFDLKLDKYVSKITVKNSSGTNTHDYENTKLAKKELIGKQLSTTSLVIEYTMIITNEGDVAGYAKKIVDYLPEELQFSSDLNSDWYIGEGDNIYNSSLANELIAPGETREVKLKLTKKMTEENLGLINNKAEIAECYNDLGVDDVDSIAGNKAQGEDDISSADVLLSVKTGGVISYIAIVAGILAVIGVAIYFINIKVIKNIK